MSSVSHNVASTLVTPEQVADCYGHWQRPWQASRIFSLRFFRWVVFHAQSSPHSTNFCRCKSRLCGTANGVLNRRVASEWATSSNGRWQRRQQMSLESEKIDSTLTGIKSNRTHPSSRKNKNQASRAPPMMLLVEALCLYW